MIFPKLSSKAILAPMAGVTDIAFRALARKYGAGLTYTEFVSSAAIVRENKTTLRMTQIDSSEKPVGVQLFGSNVQEVVQAAKIVAERFDIIDLNCGCPAYKVIKTGAGSQMLKDPKLIGTLVSKIVGAVDKAVSVKIRSGVDVKHINALEVAKIVEDAGASAITIHARTAEQGYADEADWELIKKIKESVNIPVIGNGDVHRPEIFEQRLKESGVDYIMIGRAAMTNPYIFKQIDDYSKTGVYQKVDKTRLFQEYLELAEKHKIPFLAVKHHAVQFSKGIKSGSTFRTNLMQCQDIECLKKLFSYFP